MEKWAFFNFDPLNWQAILPTYIYEKKRFVEHLPLKDL